MEQAAAGAGSYLIAPPNTHTHTAPPLGSPHTARASSAGACRRRGGGGGRGGSSSAGRSSAGSGSSTRSSSCSTARDGSTWRRRGLPLCRAGRDAALRSGVRRRRHLGSGSARADGAEGERGRAFYPRQAPWGSSCALGGGGCSRGSSKGAAGVGKSGGVRSMQGERGGRVRRGREASGGNVPGRSVGSAPSQGRHTRRCLAVWYYQ